MPFTEFNDLVSGLQIGSRAVYGNLQLSRGPKYGVLLAAWFAGGTLAVLRGPTKPNLWA